MDTSRYAALFRAEARDQLAALDAALDRLSVDGEAARSDRRAAVDEAFRAVHSLKGMAGAMGHVPLELLAHGTESLLARIRDHDATPSPAERALADQAADALAQRVDEAVAAGDAPAGEVPAERRAPHDRLLQALQRAVEDRGRGGAIGPTPEAASRDAGVFSGGAIPGETGTFAIPGETGTFAIPGETGTFAIPGETGTFAIPGETGTFAIPGETGTFAIPGETGTFAIPDGAAPATPVARRRDVHIVLASDAPLKSVRAQIALAKLEAIASVRSVHPAVPTWGDDFDGRVRVHVVTERPDADLVSAVEGAGDVQRVTVTDPPETTRAAQERLARVDVRHLDALLDLAGELVIARDRLVRELGELATRTRRQQAGTLGSTDLRALDGAARDVAQLVDTLQGEVLRTRLVPVGQGFDRLPRLVRAAAREAHKDVTLGIEGREIPVDRALVEALADPLVHLLRNAVDHGLETPAERRAAGKPAAGTLHLSVSRDRDAVRLEVRDDGRGIDRAAVIARAKRDGVPLAEGVTPESLDDDALLRLLARPGFSTANAVTSLSGRGVGIDVVATRVRALGGALTVRSVAGEGTTFTLRLPLTLAIVRALLVGAGESTYALPAAHVLEVRDTDALREAPDGSGPAIEHAGRWLPVRSLAARLGVAAPRRDGASSPADDPRRARDATGPSHDAGVAPDDAIVVVEAGGQHVAWRVEALHGQRDIVVKSFATVRGAAPWFSGATILGDGRPALIVDLGGLA